MNTPPATLPPNRTQKAFMAFLEEIESKRDDIKCSESGAYYRGHCKSGYSLVPSLLRGNPPLKSKKLKDLEHNLYHECYARAKHLFAGAHNSWENLSVLQHYRIPTRLLDWTDSLAVALFFAVGNPNPENPHIWIASGFRLNNETGASTKPRIFVAGLDAVLQDYFECFIRIEERVGWRFTKPIFIQIPWISERIRAQSGFFTVHPFNEPLDVACPKWLRRVDIPSDAIDGARKFLELAGVTEHTVFPDFVGLGAFLRRRYRL